jgi:hypothetical protein
MALEDPIRGVEMARNELTQAANSSTGWSDKQRHQFDSQRIQPLHEAGARLQRALQKASQQSDAAQKLLGS